MSSEQRSIIEERIRAFPDVIAEMPGDLAELAEFLGVESYRFTRDGLEELVQALDAFLSNGNLGAVDEDQRIWLHTRMMYLIGEVLNERHGGHWSLQSDPESDFYGHYVVGGFRKDPDRLVDSAEAAHALLNEEPPRDLLGVIDRLGRGPASNEEVPVPRTVDSTDGTAQPQRQTLDLRAGVKTSGEPVYEEVLVDRLGNQTYRLAASPGLVLGVAAGDVIELEPADVSKFRILERGGNLAVHVHTERETAGLASEIAKLGGWLDGQVKNLTIFTVPVSAGFKEIERVFNDFARREGGTEWYYGNVYDPADGATPLNWWVR